MQRLIGSVMNLNVFNAIVLCQELVTVKINVCHLIEMIIL